MIQTRKSNSLGPKHNPKPKKPTFARVIPLNRALINTNLRSNAERRMWKTQIESHKKRMIPPVRREVKSLFKKEGDAVAAAYSQAGLSGARFVISRFTPEWELLLRDTWRKVGSKAQKIVIKAHVNSLALDGVMIDLAPDDSWDKFVDDSEGILNKATSISDTNTSQVEKAAEAGTSIQDAYDKAAAGRADTIATTEVNTATNYGSLNAMQDTNANEKEWLCMMDNSRQWHVDADGQKVGIDEQFEVGDEMLDCPGDGGPENSINCNCDMSYATSEQPEEAPAIPGFETPEYPEETPTEAQERAAFEAALPAYKDVADDFESYQKKNWYNQESVNSVENYTHGYYDKMNDLIRNPLEEIPLGSAEEAIDKNISALQDIFNDPDSPTYNGTAYRGMSTDNGAFYEEFRAYEPGDTFTCAGFVSTSIDPDIAADFMNGPGYQYFSIRLTILDAEGLPVANMSAHPIEAEVVLNTGTKFDVVSKEIVPIDRSGDTGRARSAEQLNLTVKMQPYQPDTTSRDITKPITAKRWSM